MERSGRTFVVGLGNIGAAIATRLALTGVEVVGVDMSPDARAAFAADTGSPAVERWAEVAASPGDRVLVVVRTPEQAFEILGEVSATGLDLVAFVMTTLDVDSAATLADMGTESLRVIEAPLSGGRAGALDGTLTMMLAGPVERADHEFLHHHIAAHVVQFERYGQPNIAKLHNNALAAFHARAHADILMMGLRNGLDVQRLDEVLASSSGASWMGENLAVVVDDLLEKDVGFFEASFGPLPSVAVGGGSGLAGSLSEARQRLVEAAETGGHRG